MDNRLKIFRVIIVVAWSLLCATTLFAQEEAFEPIVKADLGTKKISKPFLGDFLLIGSIESYQNNLSPRSVARCQFHLSCSNYAKKALQIHGSIMGLMFFLDRYFYREHGISKMYYSSKLTSSNRVVLDDTYFLFGTNNSDFNIFDFSR